VYRAKLPEKPGLSGYQLRGMATAEEARNGGLGGALVHACTAYARNQNAQVLWCNARIVALEFYRKLGFDTIGPQFDVPDVGPHFRMWVRLD
jgi:GNAT superfamily N-acetyltransferase